MLAYFKRGAPYILLAGDLIALILFVVVGQRDHELVNEQNPVLGVLLSTLYFAVPYVVTGLFLQAFSPLDIGNHNLGDHNPLKGAGGHPYIEFFGRWFNAWLVAAPLGVLIRAFVLGRAVIPTLFIVAGMGFGGLFMLVWRVAFAVVIWWRQTRKSP